MAFVAKYESIWTTTTTPKTVSVTTAVNDVLVVYGGTSDSGTTLNTPTGGTGLTWALRTSSLVANRCGVYLWTATATTAETFTLSISLPATGGAWGFGCLQFNGITGIGVSAAAQVDASTPSLSLTTGHSASVIVVVNTDRLAGTGARTWRTGAGALSETSYAQASAMTVYGGYHANAGPAAAYIVGLTAPTNQYYTIAAVELIAPTAQGAAVLAATSALTAAGVRVAAGAASLTAVSSLSSSALLPAASASLSATSGLTTNGVDVQPAAVGLTALSAITVGSFLAEQAAAALASASALVLDGLTVKVGAATLPATTALTVAAILGPSTQMVGNSALTAAVGVQTMAAAAVLPAVASLSPAAGLVVQAFAPLSATSALVSSVTTAASATFAATSVLALSPQLTEQVGASLSAVGQLTATGQLTGLARASLAATSALAVTAPLLITGGTGALLVASSGLIAAATSVVPAFIWPTGPVVRQVKTPSYRLYAANTRTGRIGWELPFDSVSWNTPINATGTLRATLPIEATLDALHDQGALDPRTILREVLTGPYLNSLVLAFGDAAVFAGPYLPAAVPADKPTVDIGAAELIVMMDKRILFTPGTVAMADPAADLILGPTSGPGLIKAIIDAATTGPGRELPITCTTPPDSRGNEQRLFYGFDLTTAGSALSQLTAQGLADANQPSDQIGGPDYRLDPYLRQAVDGLYVSWELRIGAPYLGATIAPWVFDDATSLISQEIDASKMASTYYVPGSGTDRVKMIAVASDNSLIASGWPALEEVDGAYTSELDPARLQSYATADVARYLQPVDKWTVKARVDTEPQLGSYRVGDPMLLDIQRHPVIDPGVYARRITEISGDASAWVSLSSTEARPEL